MHFSGSENREFSEEDVALSPQPLTDVVRCLLCGNQREAGSKEVDSWLSRDRWSGAHTEA
jgi:hypothetical protein